MKAVSLELKNLSKRYGNKVAVDNLSLRVEPGELFFFLGPSGCGKTTILRIIAGFVQPNTGEIFFDNRRVNDLPPHKRNTGMVFQNFALWPHLTVEENVAYGLEVRGFPGLQKENLVARALETVRMTGLEKRYPN